MVVGIVMMLWVADGTRMSRLMFIVWHLMAMLLLMLLLLVHHVMFLLWQHVVHGLRNFDR